MNPEIKHISLDGANWRTKDDLYNAFFKAVGAPSWHGRNFNALRDSIVGGQINEVELPYTIHIHGLNEMPEETRTFVQEFGDFIKDLRKEGHEVDLVFD